MLQWEAFHHRGEEPEVWPLNDLRPHVEGKNCWCAPFREDGVLVHNSMDGRERYERGERRIA
jgi:hypothetical protein